LTLMSESLRNDGRVWVPKKVGDTRAPDEIPEDERDYYLERIYPSFGNLVPRDVASRRAKDMCDSGHGVGATKLAVYLDFADVIERNGQQWVADKYGNLFDMYKQIMGENPYQTPMRIFPAPHYAMGGLWVDYNLMSSVPGLFVLGEANFSDHGANRLGASALMQGLADGYFVIPYTIGGYLAKKPHDTLDTSHEAVKTTEKEVQDKLNQLLSIQGDEPVEELHKRLGQILWENVGMSRNKEGLEKALKEIPALREEFWKKVKIPGKTDEYNPELEKASRVADFMELAELIAQDALNREESCGAHFREEYQTEENEAKRNDEDFAYSANWEFDEVGKPEILHKEDLVFENVELTTRSYK